MRKPVTLTRAFSELFMLKNRKRNFTTTSLSNSREQSLKEPSGDVGGLSTRISILETVIHELAEKGEREALREALREYFWLWVELERGES